MGRGERKFQNKAHKNLTKEISCVSKWSASLLPDVSPLVSGRLTATFKLHTSNTLHKLRIHAVKRSATILCPAQSASHKYELRPYARNVTLGRTCDAAAAGAGGEERASERGRKERRRALRFPIFSPSPPHKFPIIDCACATDGGRRRRLRDRPRTAETRFLPARPSASVG